MSTFFERLRYRRRLKIPYRRRMEKEEWKQTIEGFQQAVHVLGRFAVAPLIGAFKALKSQMEAEGRIGTNYEARISACECALLAAEALGELGDARAVKPLIKVLNSPEYIKLGLCVCKALGKLGDVRAVDPLINVLTSELWSRCDAAAALGLLGDPRAIDPLIVVATNGDWEARRVAAEALEKLGEPVWKDLVSENDSLHFERLRGCRDPRVVNLQLERVAADPFDQCALAALAELGDRRAVEPLIKALKSSDRSSVGDYYRHTAAKGLGNFDGVAVVNSLAQILEDDYLRYDAAESLLKVAPLDCKARKKAQEIVHEIVARRRDSDSECSRHCIGQQCD